MKKNEKPAEPERLERDPEDDSPRPKKWEVTFTMQRTIVVEGVSNAKEAEEKARDEALFDDEFPVDREEITDTHVGWINPDPEADQNVVHLEGCYGRHCRHYDCDTSELASNYDEYCSQCDINAY